MSTGTIIVTLFPVVFLVVSFVFIFRSLRKSTQRSTDYVKRMEAKSDQMIAILEQIRDALANRPK